MKKLFFVMVAAGLCILLLLAVSEIILRITGLTPFAYRATGVEVPVMAEPDDVLGWKHKEGTYRVPAFDPSGRVTTITILPGGPRATGKERRRSADLLVTVGGSFTHGQAISDRETFAWKLQERFPRWSIQNYGTCGYGTYQSLLLLERLFPGATPPSIVLYGFVDIHQVRNVAAPGWIEMLTRYSRRGKIQIPYCTLDEQGRLVRQTPASWPFLPLHETFALPAFLEKSYMSLAGKGRIAMGRKVTKKLLQEMRDLCRNHGARFFVAILCADVRTRSEFKVFFKRNGIEFIDCVFPVTPDMQVPGEGHPSGKMNTLWADRIAEALSEYME